MVRLKDHGDKNAGKANSMNLHMKINAMEKMNEEKEMNSEIKCWVNQSQPIKRILRIQDKESKVKMKGISE